VGTLPFLLPVRGGRKGRRSLTGGRELSFSRFPGGRRGKRRRKRGLATSPRWPGIRGKGLTMHHRPSGKEGKPEERDFTVNQKGGEKREVFYGFTPGLRGGGRGLRGLAPPMEKRRGGEKATARRK